MVNQIYGQPGKNGSISVTIKTAFLKEPKPFLVIHTDSSQKVSFYSHRPSGHISSVCLNGLRLNGHCVHVMLPSSSRALDMGLKTVTKMELILFLTGFDRTGSISVLNEFYNPINSLVTKTVLIELVLFQF